MKLNKILFLATIVAITVPFFSGCIKSYKLAPSETPQGIELADHRKVVKNNIRTVRVYNQWETDAVFDILRLSDQARSAFVDDYCTRRGLDDNEREAIRERELHKNNEYVHFYVLADVRDRYHEALTDENAKWTFALQTDFDTNVTTSHISEVTFAPEYQRMFGHRLSKFKRAYEITFKAAIANDDPLKLVISSPARSATASWGFDDVVKVTENKKEKLEKDEDLYWL